MVIGRRTYGKGLVQEQFELGDGSALRLTIARYYTPSGRSIQRPYDKGRDAYDNDFVNRFRNGSLTSQDTLMASDTAKYFTEEKHRIVYGGGGIKPDIIVPYELTLFTDGLYDLLGASALNNTVYTFFSQHSREMNQYKSFNQFDRAFQVTPELMARLKENLSKDYPAQVKNVWSNTAALAYLNNRVKGDPFAYAVPHERLFSAGK